MRERLRQASSMALMAAVAAFAALVLAACNQPPPKEESPATKRAESSQTADSEPTSPASTLVLDSERFPILNEHSHPWMFRFGSRLILSAWYDHAVRVSEVGPHGGEMGIFSYGRFPGRLIFVDVAYLRGSYYVLLAEPDEQGHPTGRTSFWQWSPQKMKFLSQAEEMPFTGVRLIANEESLFVLAGGSWTVYRVELAERLIGKDKPVTPAKFVRAFSLNELLRKEGLGKIPKKLLPRLLTFQGFAGGFLLAGVSSSRAQDAEELQRWIITTDSQGALRAKLVLEPAPRELSGEMGDAQVVPFAAGGDRFILAAYDNALHWLDASLQVVAERPLEASPLGDEGYGPVPLDDRTTFAWDDSTVKVTIQEFDLERILPAGQVPAE